MKIVEIHELSQATYDQWNFSLADVTTALTEVRPPRWWQFIRRYRQWQFMRTWKCADSPTSGGRFSSL